MSKILAPRLPGDRPIRALHVGNFVGVSLCFFTSLVRARHPRSVVVSVDPNTEVRGVDSPQSHVLALLDHYGLLANSLIIPGYTLEQTFGEPGAPDETDLSKGLACENVLASLDTLQMDPFDVALIDGNHDLEYLEREFVAVRQLLAGGSIVVFDDIVDWEGVREVFERALADQRCTDLGQDGPACGASFETALVTSGSSAILPAMESGAELIAQLQGICGTEHVLTHPDALATYRSDGLKQYRETPLAAVLPGHRRRGPAGRAGLLRGGCALGRARLGDRPLRRRASRRGGRADRARAAAADPVGRAGRRPRGGRAGRHQPVGLTGRLPHPLLSARPLEPDRVLDRRQRRRELRRRPLLQVRLHRPTT